MIGRMAALIVELPHGDYLISTDPARVDLVEVHRFLSEDSYWAQGRPFEVQRRAIEHSALVVGAYTAAGEQVGFARMVTDLATWAWLCDVYVLPDHQGGGLGTVMVGTIVEHPDVVAIRRQFLATRDAHELYAKFGYRPLDDPSIWMVRLPDASNA
jgi:GNAT superfamily N-acetyltransferase